MSKQKSLECCPCGSKEMFLDGRPLIYEIGRYYKGAEYTEGVCLNDNCNQELRYEPATGKTYLKEATQ